MDCGLQNRQSNHVQLRLRRRVDRNGFAGQRSLSHWPQGRLGWAVIESEKQQDGLELHPHRVPEWLGTLSPRMIEQFMKNKLPVFLVWACALVAPIDGLIAAE